MYRILYLFVLTFFININAQNTDVISWINTNAIAIEDANPDMQLTIFSKNVPQNFKDARVFGFGEADHRTKEFFNLKAKFFKYLVQSQGIRVFIMEESYQAERGINEWISGGAGDKATIVKNFGMSIWYNDEIANLLQWMRDYNTSKPREEQIRFYGMDNQFGNDINTRLRSYVEKNNITINENLLAVADSCSAAKLKAGGLKGWDKKVLPKLQQIKQILERNKEQLIANNANEYNDMIRALEHIEQYTVYISAPYSQVRDKDMYNNVLKILDLEGANSKAFIWAHNEHINKKDFASYNIKSVGTHLKDHFKDAYYAVGFDFGNGVIVGFNKKDGQITGWDYRELDKPYQKTFAETLFKVQPDIYFIDMTAVKENSAATKFFSTKMQQLFLGGPGFDPEKKTMIKRKYIETYDALIFVKTISPATYHKF